MAKNTKKENPELEQETPVNAVEAPVDEKEPQKDKQEAPAEAESAPETITYIVDTAGRGLNLREAPGGKVRAILPDGCAVVAAAYDPGQAWVEVYAGDLCGWVKSEFLRPLDGGEM